MNKKSFCIIVFLIFLLLFLNKFVFAQRGLEVQYPEFGGIKPETTAVGLPNYVKYIFVFSISFAGLVALFSLIYAGFRYLTSTGDPAKQRDAKDQIFSAIFGLLILLGSYLILTTINPQLVFLRTPLIEKCDCQKSLAELSPDCQRICQPFLPKEEETTFRYTEIPIGGISAALLSKEELNNLKNISEGIKKAAEKVKIRAQELKTETDSCSCSSNTSPTGSCSAGSCGSPACVNNCGSCSGEPCANRDEIEEKREELALAIRELKGEYWPGGAVVQGIYLCKKDFCRGEENIDWKYFPPTQREVANLSGNWSDKITALAIIGPYDIQVFDKPNLDQEERYICFQDSVPRLDDYDIVPPRPPQYWGWALDISSLKILDDGECRLPGVTMQGPFPSTKAGKLPARAEKEGIYLCDDDQCLAGWRGASADIADLCGSEAEDPNWAEPRGNDICAPGSQVGSLAIKGNFDAVLYEDDDFQNRRICFQDSVGRLDDYSIAPNNGWNEDADSIKILKDGECQNPGVTMLDPRPSTVAGLRNLTTIQRNFLEKVGKLREAEGKIKKCSSEPSKGGKNQGLYSSADFWGYREYLERQELIKSVIPEHPFADIVAGVKEFYLPSTFYCAENIFEIEPVKIGEEELRMIGQELKKAQEEPLKKEPICGQEIEIGKAVDKAIELTSQILREISGILVEVNFQITAAENLVNFSDQDCSDGKCCAVSNCSTAMSQTSAGCNSFSCGWWSSTSTEDRVCLSDSTEYGVCATCYSYYYCNSCSCSCGGNACPAEIPGLKSQVEESYLEIERAQKELKDLIEEKKELKRTVILKKLNESQEQLGDCYNSTQTRERIEKGESVIWRELFDCSLTLLYSELGSPLYDKKEKEIRTCYGPTEEKPNLMNNYFCCQIEIATQE